MLGAGGVTATEHQLIVFPCVEAPGYATLLGGSERREFTPLPIEEAEMIKINHERSVTMLEQIHDMPLTTGVVQKLCRHCRSVATQRCSACRSWYCSRACQRQNWPYHVFVCRALARPNDVDFLRLMVIRVARDITSAEGERLHNVMHDVLSDDHICSTFGFKHCGNALEVINLVRIYSAVFTQVHHAARVLQKHLQKGSLSKFLVQYCEREQQNSPISETTESSPVTWFLERWDPEVHVIPDVYKATYDIWNVAAASAVKTLGLTDWFEKGRKLNTSQTDVINLYLSIQPTIGLLPDIYSSSWIKFGFCYCRSFSQRKELAQKYLTLALSEATFDDIVSAYERSSLESLMCAHNIDISNLTEQGVRLRRPPPYDYSIYRLMIGVEHALSGRFCSCFCVDKGRDCRDCHAYYETHVDCDSDVNFGFHLTNSWERWQLLNFYHCLFRSPNFHARLMAQAVEDPDLDSLEHYLDGLIPGMRNKLWNKHRANILFPNLKHRPSGWGGAGQNSVHDHLPCRCKEHNVFGPPGISHSLEALCNTMD